MPITIFLLTSSRADYGIYKPLINKIVNDPFFTIKIVVFGTHLSHFHGYTIREIEQDGFGSFITTVECLALGDTPESVTTTMGLTQIKFASFWERHLNNIDMIFCLGDRFEMLSAVLASLPFQLPVVHFYGGERTEGLIDEFCRHALTKLSHLHFTSTVCYRQRVIQLGEHPDTVFNVGALGIEAIKSIQFFSKSELEHSIPFKFGQRNVLITFHPVTLENNTALIQTKSLLKALLHFKDVHFIFTKPNMDTHNHNVVDAIDCFVKGNADRAVSCHSLGQRRYFSVLKYVDVVVGNSSSGIIEVPSFNIPTVNIGDRQKGRIRAASVIDCEPTENAITLALTKALSKSFRETAASCENPFDGGNTTDSILSVLKSTSIKNIKKCFFDLPK